MSSTGTNTSRSISNVELKRALQQMDPFVFEEFIADLWGLKGWHTQVDGGSQDRGVDVRATQSYPYDQKLLIQAKRYGPDTTVGSPDIQQYASLAHQEDDVDKVLVVTTNGFSRQALELADDLNVKTIDGNGLVHIIHEENAEDLVAEYIPALEAEPEVSTSEAESQPQDADPDVHERLVATRSWVVRLSALWAVALVAAILIPADAVMALAGLAMLVAWVGLPIAIVRDGRAVKRHTEWSPWWILYAFGSVIPGWAPVVGALYLLRRRGKVGTADD